MKAMKWCARYFLGLTPPVRRIENYEPTILKFPPISLSFLVLIRLVSLLGFDFFFFQKGCYSLVLLSFSLDHWKKTK